MNLNHLKNCLLIVALGVLILTLGNWIKFQQVAARMDSIEMRQKAQAPRFVSMRDLAALDSLKSGHCVVVSYEVVNALDPKSTVPAAGLPTGAAIRLCPIVE